MRLRRSGPTRSHALTSAIHGRRNPRGEGTGRAARAAGARRRARVARVDDAHPPLRGARGRDVREGEGRRLPPPRHRRGGDDRRRRPRDARRGLPDLDLPLARPRAVARRGSQQGHGRAVRPRVGRVARPRRLDAHVRPREPLHGRLRDRRRQPPARRGHGAVLRLPRHRRGDAVRVRRRRLQPGHVRRDAQPRRAVAPAGRLHGHEQPVRHGHRARAPLRRHRPAPARRGLRRARHALRRHGRARHPRGDRRGAQEGARGAPAGARRGDHLPLPRPLDGRPRGVPHQGAGRRVAQEGPDPDLRAQARGGGHPRGRRGRQDGRGDGQGRRRRRPLRRQVEVPAARVALRRHLRARRPGQGLVLGRRALRRRARGREGARARQGGARPDRRLRRRGRAGLARGPRARQGVRRGAGRGRRRRAGRDD